MPSIKYEIAPENNFMQTKNCYSSNLWLPLL